MKADAVELILVIDFVFFHYFQFGARYLLNLGAFAPLAEEGDSRAAEARIFERATICIANDLLIILDQLLHFDNLLSGKCHDILLREPTPDAFDIKDRELQINVDFIEDS